MRHRLHALQDAGHDPQVIKAGGLGMLPEMFNRTEGRQEVKRLTGNVWVPVLVTDDEQVIQGSREIAEWARTHPAPRPPAPRPAAVDQPAHARGSAALGGPRRHLAGGGDRG